MYLLQTVNNENNNTGKNLKFLARGYYAEDYLTQNANCTYKFSNVKQAQL